MAYISYIPSPPLNTYIDDLYYLDGPAAYPRQKILPVASANLMINFGDPFNVYAPDQARPFMACTDSWWVEAEHPDYPRALPLNLPIG